MLYRKNVWNTNKASIANVANFLKEPIEKRRRLARYFRAYRPLRFSLSGSGVTEESSGLAIRTSSENDERTLILQEVII